MIVFKNDEVERGIKRFMQPFKRDEIRQDVKNLTGFVLTFYLNTDPTSEEWRIRLKNGLKRTEEYYEAANRDQVKTLKKISKKVNVKVRDMRENLANSLICFASEDKILLYPFQFPVENDFIWRDEPATEQLERLFKKYDRSGVVLLQANSVTLITATLGEVEDEIHYEIDFDTEDWTRYRGLAYGSIISSSANHRHKFERRMRENQARWYRKIIPTIRNYAKERRWKSVYLIGPASLTNNMRTQLNQKVTAEINRNYSGRSAHAVLAKTIYAPKTDE